MRTSQGHAIFAAVGLTIAAFGGTAQAASQSAPSCTSNVSTVNMSTHDQWQWYEDDSGHPMKCLDGTFTGFGYYVPSGWNGNVVFVFDGGGMCYDQTSCANVGAPNLAIIAGQIFFDTKPNSNAGVPFMARTSYKCSTDFTTDVTNNFSDANGVNWGSSGSSGNTSVLARGMFDSTHATNPLQKYMKVFVPYCTGDMHAGNRVDTSTGVSGRTPSQKTFYGQIDTYYTLFQALAAATAADGGHQPPKIVLAGGSAGGWGALYSYGILRNGIIGPPSNGAKVFVIDDGGMPLPSGASTDHQHWTQTSYLQLEGPNPGQPMNPVSSMEEWQYDAWGGSGWAQWFGSTSLTSQAPLGDGYDFVSSRAVSLYATQQAVTPGSLFYGDKLLFIDGSSDWMYWYLTPTLWMNDDPHGNTPKISTAQGQMTGINFFPVTNTAMAGLAPYFKHHVFIEDDVSTWGSSGSNILPSLSALGL